jgi:hypothetical protein
MAVKRELASRGRDLLVGSQPHSAALRPPASIEYLRHKLRLGLCRRPLPVARKSSRTKSAPCVQTAQASPASWSSCAPGTSWRFGSSTVSDKASKISFISLASSRNATSTYEEARIRNFSCSALVRRGSAPALTIVSSNGAAAGDDPELRRGDEPVHRAGRRSVTRRFVWFRSGEPENVC